MGAILSKCKRQAITGDEDGVIDMGMTEKQYEQLLLDEEEIGPEEDVIFRTIYDSERVIDLFTSECVANEENAHLKQIFDGMVEEPITQLTIYMKKDKIWELDFEQDVIIAYWLAIHTLNIEVANKLLSIDPQLRCITCLAFNRSKEQNAKKRKKAENAEIALREKLARNEKSGLVTPGTTSKMDMSSPSPVMSAPDKKGSTNIDLEGGRQSSFHKKDGDRLRNDINLNFEQFEGGDDDSKDEDDESCGDEGEGEEEESSESFDSNSDEESGADDDWGEPKAIARKESNISGKGEEDDSDEDDDDNVEEEKNNAGDDVNNQDIYNLAPAVSLSDITLFGYLKKEGLTGLDVEKTEIRTIQQIRKVKAGFQKNFPLFMAGVLKILLFKKEEDLACMLTAFYDLDLDETMYNLAIRKGQYKWLQYLWIFKKNFLGAKSKNNRFMLVKLFHTINSIYTLENLPQKIREEVEIVCNWNLREDFKVKVTEENGEEEEQVEVEEEDDEHKEDVDNILKALLMNSMEDLAFKYLGKYEFYLNQELFRHALEKNSQKFLQSSLNIGAFDKQMFKEQKIAESIINNISIGSKMNGLLNILVLIDIKVWTSNNIGQLIEIFNNLIDEDYEDNLLLLSFNPIMTIALTAELLTMVGESKKQFENQCNDMKEAILELGQTFNLKIGDDEAYYKSLIMDVDFQNRTVLKIITIYNFMPLLCDDDPKASNLMNEIYIGEDATQCDGTLLGYSTFMHILTSKPQKGTETENIPFMDMITCNFGYKHQVDYTFQHRYRSQSIAAFFQKELVFGLAIMFIGIQLYLLGYVNAFRGSDGYYITLPTMINQDSPASILMGRPELTQILTLTIACNNDTCNSAPREEYDFEKLNPLYQYNKSDEESMGRKQEDMEKQYTNFQKDNFPIQFILSVVLGLSLVFRIVMFNFFKEVGTNILTVDTFLSVDVLFAGVSIGVFQIIGIFQQMYPEIFWEDKLMDKKDLIDLCVCVVLILNYTRFGSLFLVVDQLSQMLLTLGFMLGDVLPFLTILTSYIIWSSQTTSTFFQDINDEAYGNLFQSVQTNFDVMLGAYDYTGTKDGFQEMIYTFWLLIHLFMANILLLNFLIAILSSTYGDMLESGKFQYKRAKFTYCERYMIALKEPNGYGQLVIHAPPMNILCLILVPFTPFKSLMPKIANLFSKFIFWLENIVFMVIFIVGETILAIIVYFMTIYNIIYSTQGLFANLFFVFGWIPTGFLFLLQILFKDVVNLLFLWSRHNGCLADQADGKQSSDEEKEVELQQKLEWESKVFEEVRQVVIEKYKEIKILNRIKKDDDDDSEDGSESEEKPDKDDDDSENAGDVILDVLKMLEEDEEEGYKPDLEIFMVKLVGLQDEWRKMRSSKIKNQAASQDVKAEEKQDVEDTGLEQVKAVELTGEEYRKKRLRDELIGNQANRNIPNTDKPCPKQESYADIKKAMIDKLVGQDETQVQGGNEDDGGGKIKAYNQDEDDYVFTILQRFLIGSENSNFLDTINITLLMKAIPDMITKNNAEQLKNFNFHIVQQSIVAYKNKEQGDAFEYYDLLNNKRVTEIKECILEQKADLDKVQNIFNCIENIVEHNEDTFQEYQICWEKMREEKKFARKIFAEEEEARQKAQAEAEAKEDAKRKKKPSKGKK